MFILSEYILFFHICLLILFCLLYNLADTLNYPSVQMPITYLSFITNGYFFFSTLQTIWYGHLVMDMHSTLHLSSIFIILISSFLLFFYFIYSFFYNKKMYLPFFEYPILILVLLCCLCWLLNTNDLFFLFLVLETIAMIFYILTSFNKNSKYALISGLKYFIISSISGVIYLLGISFIYYSYGTSNLDDILFFLKSNFSISYICVIGILLLFLSFCIKLFLFPFHYWLIDIYHNAPNSSIFVLATFNFINYYYIIIKFFLPLVLYIPSLYILLGIIVLSSLLIGTLGAIIQSSIKRLIAYSSISQYSYFLIAILSNDIYLISQNISYVLLYILNLLSFFIILLHIWNINDKLFIDDMLFFVGLFKKNPLLSILLMVNGFMLIALPPFSLFINKVHLLIGLGFWGYYGIVVYILIIALIGLYYYVQIIEKMLYGELGEYKNKIFLNIPLYASSASSGITLIVFFYFLYPSFLDSVCMYFFINMFN